MATLVPKPDTAYSCDWFTDTVPHIIRANVAIGPHMHGPGDYMIDVRATAEDRLIKADAWCTENGVRPEVLALTPSANIVFRFQHPKDMLAFRAAVFGQGAQ